MAKVECWIIVLINSFLYQGCAKTIFFWNICHQSPLSSLQIHCFPKTNEPHLPFSQILAPGPPPPWIRFKDLWKDQQLTILFYGISFRCDPGFSGPACEMASQTFPMFISESFGSSRLSSYHNFYSIRGAEVSFGCGVLASGKALVFNKDGRRQLITSFLDSSQSRWVKTGWNTYWNRMLMIEFRSLYFPFFFPFLADMYIFQF